MTEHFVTIWSLLRTSWLNTSASNKAYKASNMRMENMQILASFLLQTHTIAISLELKHQKMLSKRSKEFSPGCYKFRTDIAHGISWSYNLALS